MPGTENTDYFSPETLPGVQIANAELFQWRKTSSKPLKPLLLLHTFKNPHFYYSTPLVY